MSPHACHMFALCNILVASGRTLIGTACRGGWLLRTRVLGGDAYLPAAPSEDLLRKPSAKVIEV